MIEKTFYDQETQTSGFLVIEDERLPIATGGLRIDSHVTLDEVRNLSRLMGEKFKLYQFPISGAKSGLALPENFSASQREKAIQNFALKIKDFLYSVYILGEDMGTTPADVEILYNAIGIHRQIASKNILKKAKVKTPLIYLPDLVVRYLPSYSSFGPRLAGRVMAKMLANYQEEMKTPLTITLMGVGSIGKSILCCLDNDRFRVIALSDKDKTIRFFRELKPKEALSLILPNGILKEDKAYGEYFPAEHILEVPCDIFVPAANGNLINEKNKRNISCKAIFEAANNMTTPELELELFERGILIFPDFLVNSAISTSFGIIVTSKKMIWSQGHLECLTENLMLKKFQEIFTRSKIENRPMREIIYKDWQRS